MNKLSLYLCGITIALQVVSSGFAASSITEDFNQTSIHPALAAPNGYVFGSMAIPSGTAQNVVLSHPRVFVTTASTDYNVVDFVYEITATVRSGGPEEGAFIGIGGDVISDPTAFPEPHASVYLRLFPNGFGGAVDLSLSPNASTWENAALSIAPHPGEGIYRVRIHKTGDYLSLSCDANYDGVNFVPDYAVVRRFSQELSFLTATNSRLFFGVQGNQTTFDDLSIKVSRPTIPTLSIRSEIDGRSRLVIRPGRIFWDHIDAAIPGFGSLFTNAPTTLNGSQWFPKWPSSEVCCSSAVSGTLTTHVAFAQSPITISKREGRGTVTIFQQPTPDNDMSLIVEFDDRFSPGADWYDVVLNGVAFSTPLSIDVTQVAIRWLSLMDYKYQVQFSDLGTPQIWRNLGSPLQGTGSIMVMHDDVFGDRRVYRVLPVLVE